MRAEAQAAEITALAEVKSRLSFECLDSHTFTVYCIRLSAMLPCLKRRVRKLWQRYQLVFGRKSMVSLIFCHWHGFAQAKIHLFKEGNVMQLEQMRIWVEGAKALAKAPQPAVLMNAGANRLFL